MHITYISIFPEIFQSFLETSLIKKAQEKGILSFSLVNPRDFCVDKHRQIDDEIYGGGAGMLMKAIPVIDAVEDTIKKGEKKFFVLYPTPTEKVFVQEFAHHMTEIDHLIFVCGRYEGIDYRFEQYMMDKYPNNFAKISLGQFVVLGGELPAMVMSESIVRLISGVIKEEASWQDESYSIEHDMKNLEYPQYTRPEEVYGYKIPEILLSGHHKNIEKWRKEQSKKI